MFRDQVATTSESGGMAAMFGGGGSSSFLMTPPLIVESAKEALLFSVKSGSSDDGMAGMGASAINYGMPQANSTETFAVVNTGTGTLQVGVATTDEKTFALSRKELAIDASDTTAVDVTYVFDQESLGIHQGAVTFTPTTSVLVPISSGLTAYSTYADA